MAEEGMYFFKAMARWAIAYGLSGLFHMYYSLAMHIRIEVVILTLHIRF